MKEICLKFFLFNEVCEKLNVRLIPIFYLKGYERQKHPLVDAELEKMLLDTHETFKCYPTAMDITLGWETFHSIF